MIKLLAMVLMMVQLFSYAQTHGPNRPMRVGVAGLTHGHVHWILRSAKEGIVEVVGIAEPNRELADRLMKQYSINPSVWYADLTAMINGTKPEAVTAFGSILDHLAVVQACAPRKIHVMVEKPLAISLDHAKQMQKLANDHKIHLLTNYETTWYGSHHTAFGMLHDGKQFGPITKVVVHDGHQGPREIGVNKEFFDWLTDPRYNGAGALMDFGCYGANLITWLMKGERPVSVSAITQQIKPEIYPKVDDEATIVVTYPKAQCIIQASWNWPYSRKDIEIYGRSGYVHADRDGIRFMTDAAKGEQRMTVPFRDPPYNDPFLFLAAVVRGDIVLAENDLSSLPVNMVAMEILQAARESAAAGKVVLLNH